MNKDLAILCAKYCQQSYIGDPEELGLLNTHSLAYGDLFCIIGENKDYGTFIILRGTVTLGGWKLDFNAEPVKHPKFSGMIHKGFADAYDQIWPWIYTHTLVSKSLYITGHSLGAALATLISVGVGRSAEIYTFGSPRVGTGGFIAPDQYRFVNGFDIVPTVPSWPFKHVGTEFKIGSRAYYRYLTWPFRRDHWIDNYIYSLTDTSFVSRLLRAWHEHH